MKQIILPAIVLAAILAGTMFSFPPASAQTSTNITFSGLLTAINGGPLCPDGATIFVTGSASGVPDTDGRISDSGGTNSIAKPAQGKPCVPIAQWQFDDGVASGTGATLNGRVTKSLNQNILPVGTFMSADVFFGTGLIAIHFCSLAGCQTFLGTGTVTVS